MRASLVHPLADRRPARRRRRRNEARRRTARKAQPIAVAVQVESAEQRVREAGGPVDRASYSCSCGMLFQAKVSTTVLCPHCGAAQAW